MNVPRKDFNSWCSSFPLAALKTGQQCHLQTGGKGKLNAAKYMLSLPVLGQALRQRLTENYRARECAGKGHPSGITPGE